MKLLRENPFYLVADRILPYLFSFALMISGTPTASGQTEDTNAVKSSDELVAMNLKTSDKDDSHLWELRRNFQSASEGRTREIKILIGILNDPKSKNGSKICAANYLGILRADEAANDLAAQITLKHNVPIGGTLAQTETYYNIRPSFDALIAIGTASIPPVIRNLAESDDTKVRDLSLKVLNGIEGDKDIVQLRLQKALKAEKDPQKQARLQSALKMLREMK